MDNLFLRKETGVNATVQIIFSLTADITSENITSFIDDYTENNNETILSDVQFARKFSM